MDECATLPATTDNNSILIGETDSQSQLSLQSSSSFNQSQSSLHNSSPQSQGHFQGSPQSSQSLLDAKDTKDLRPNEPLIKQDTPPPEEGSRMEIDTPDSDTTKAVDSRPAKRDRSCDKNTPENKAKKMNPSKHGSRTSEILDFSDPLQNYQVSKDETIFHSKGTLEEDKAHKFRFKKALKEVHLSSSPCIQYSIPFLETEEGLKSSMRKFFSGQLYWSQHFEDRVGKKKPHRSWLHEESPVKEAKVAKLADPHRFVHSKLTAPLSDPHTQVSHE